jgi:hypothetical protein
LKYGQRVSYLTDAERGRTYRRSNDVENTANSMKSAELYPVSIPAPPGFVWKWRSVDGATVSRECFMYFHDCLADARARGYSVEIERVYGAARPGADPLSAARQSDSRTGAARNRCTPESIVSACSVPGKPPNTVSSLSTAKAR